MQNDLFSLCIASAGWTVVQEEVTLPGGLWNWCWALVASCSWCEWSHVSYLMIFGYKHIVLIVHFCVPINQITWCSAVLLCKIFVMFWFISIHGSLYLCAYCVKCTETTFHIKCIKKSKYYDQIMHHSLISYVHMRRPTNIHK